MTNSPSGEENEGRPSILVWSRQKALCSSASQLPASPPDSGRAESGACIRIKVYVGRDEAITFGALLHYPACLSQQTSPNELPISPFNSGASEGPGTDGCPGQAAIGAAIQGGHILCSPLRP